MPTGRINIGDLRLGQVTIKPDEHPDDRAVRLEAERRNARYESYKDITTFAASLLGLILTAAACAYFGLLDNNASPDTKRWAQTVLSSVITGAVSFVVGRKVGSR